MNFMRLHWFDIGFVFALITGGASGFGRGFAFAYAEKGADLVLVDIKEELLEETSKQLKQITKKKVIPIICDVSKSDQVNEMAKQAFSELDNIFILNNNAGVGLTFGKDLLRITEEQFDMDQELGVFYCIAYEFLALKRKGKTPPFIVMYRETFLKQVDKGDFNIKELTPTERAWLKLIEMRDDLKLNYQPGTTLSN